MKTLSMDKFTSNLSYFCSGVFAALGALSRDDWTFIIFIVTGVSTFLINWIYKHRADRRAELESKAKIKQYEKHIKDNNRRDL